MQTILIIDDDTAVCASLRLLLRRAGYHAVGIHRPAEVMDTLQEHHPNLVLLDMNFSIDTSGKDGLNLLRRIKAVSPRLPVILMTGWATVQLAVEGMKIGARDFIAKPWNNRELLESIKTILHLEGPVSSKDQKGPTGFDHIIGNSGSLQEVITQARRVSPTKASVLITGESGTGKELIAEAIHYESDRADQAFVKVNLGGLTTSLFESEMFGHRKGAFTDAHSDREGRFAKANQGSIFLDEIGDLPMSSQVKLLRVLQEGTFEVLGSSQSKSVNVRVISATNKDLKKMVQEGSFREDLLYRINLIHLHLPPLRERPSDIPSLVQHFLQNLRQAYDRPALAISEEAIQWLKDRTFPGNIRQLKNLVERSVLLAANNELGIDDFTQNYQDPAYNQDDVELPRVGRITLEEMEIKAIKKALEYHKNQIAATARSLGITRSALYRRLQKYRIPYES